MTRAGRDSGPNKENMTLGRRLTALAALCAGSVLMTYAGAQGGLNEQFVPYQISVLLAGYLLPMNWAVACAVLSPVLGAVFVGFPTALVMLPLAACQMIALGAFANFLYTMLGMRPFTVFFSAVTFSYVILFCAAAIYSAVSNDIVSPLAYVRDTLFQTWPGLVLLLTVPTTVSIGCAAANERSKG